MRTELKQSGFLSDEEAILREFVEESRSSLEVVPSLLVQLEATPWNDEVVNAVFRPIHSIKGNSAFLGLLNVKCLAHELESVLDLVRKNRLDITPKLMEALFTGVHELSNMMTRIDGNQEAVEDRAAFEAVVRRVAAARGGEPESLGLPPQPAAAAPETAAPAKPAAQEPRPPAREAAVTVRVPAEDLDACRALLCELDDACRAFDAIEQRLNRQPAGKSAGPELRDHAVRLGDLLTRLQQNLSFMVNIPFGSLAKRAAMIVDHLSSASGKQIALHFGGEDIPVSRTLMRALEAPLLHLLRNAVDHGIELPDARREAGKPPEGRIWIEARREGKQVVLRLADDGQGIDYKALLRKAMEQGLCPANRKLTPDDVNNLLFHPGLSTAEIVTDVSGRGMGMDIVRNSIQSVGGKISVASRPGKGTEFQILFPAGA
ncbi:MAG: Hpt domain-containing protein [Kiritimatiellae bacterium]|nr:Hpt domain-containing protein [Kiritimatiellia bacterium]